MKIYAHFGFCNFILCLGFEGDKIREYCKKLRHWKITCVDTGIDTNTGGRIKKVKKYIKEDYFFATYGDGLANINLSKLLDFHKYHKRAATLTVVKPSSPFGIVGIDSHTDVVTHFEEKPILEHWINGGFFVFNNNVFKYIEDRDILEKNSFQRMVKDKNLAAYKHYGFWECMDTYKDNLRLNQFWKKGKAPWKIWERKV
jgi:glucose-1-phosphate cytidylyltransferase